MREEKENACRQTKTWLRKTLAFTSHPQPSPSTCTQGCIPTVCSSPPFSDPCSLFWRKVVVTAVADIIGENKTKLCAFFSNGFFSSFRLCAVVVRCRSHRHLSFIVVKIYLVLVLMRTNTFTVNSNLKFSPKSNSTLLRGDKPTRVGVDNKTKINSSPIALKPPMRTPPTCATPAEPRS